eukprot:9267046-Lingulodinium_polyedra.AAC.1
MTASILSVQIARWQCPPRLATGLGHCDAAVARGIGAKVLAAVSAQGPGHLHPLVCEVCA